MISDVTTICGPEINFHSGAPVPIRLGSFEQLKVPCHEVLPPSLPLVTPLIHHGRQISDDDTLDSNIRQHRIYLMIQGLMPCSWPNAMNYERAFVFE